MKNKLLKLNNDIEKLLIEQKLLIYDTVEYYFTDIFNLLKLIGFESNIQCSTNKQTICKFLF